VNSHRIGLERAMYSSPISTARVHCVTAQTHHHRHKRCKRVTCDVTVRASRMAFALVRIQLCFARIAYVRRRVGRIVRHKFAISRNTAPLRSSTEDRANPRLRALYVPFFHKALRHASSLTLPSSGSIVALINAWRWCLVPWFLRPNALVILLSPLSSGVALHSTRPKSPESSSRSMPFGVVS
jgi:hypothetical protein